MGPATVCSCEHRSTNVPVLSFHKLSRDLVQLARERWLMMGWWDGKKDQKIVMSLRKDCVLSLQNGMMVWDVAILVEFIMT